MAGATVPDQRASRSPFSRANTGASTLFGHRGDGPADREEVYPQRAGDVALAITEVFAVQAPADSLARGETTLELLRAGVARQLAVLDDPELTGTGQSSAEVLGVRAGMLAEKLADHLVSAILARGSRGRPLLPLANQLNHDLTHEPGDAGGSYRAARRPSRDGNRSTR